MNSIRGFLNQQLLFCVTLCYLSGLLATNLFLLPPPTLYTGLVLCFAITLLFAVTRKNNLARAFLCLTFILTGFLAAQHTNSVPEEQNHIYTISDKHTDLVIIGKLTTMVEKYDDHARLVISAQQYRTRQFDDFRPATGTIIMRVQGDWNKQLLPGDTIIVRANVFHPKPASTEGGFDYKRYLARKNIWAEGYLRSQVLIEKIEEPATLYQKIRYLPERIRAKLADLVIKQIEGRDGGLFRAILFGSKTQVDPKTIEIFRETGVMHVLTISGLHISIFGAMLYAIFYFLLSRSEWLMLRIDIRKAAALISVMPLTLYALLAGGNTPVIRALFMALVVILALLTDRKKSFLPLISFAAFSILLCQPQSIYTASFQLSFGAVIAILGGKEIIQSLLQQRGSLLHRLLYRTAAGLGVSLLATAGIAPLLLYHFNHISLIGPITNLIVEPLICLWGLPFGFAAILCAPFSTTLTELLLQLGNIGLQVALGAAKWLHSLPFTLSLWLPAPPVVLLIIYYLLLSILLQPSFINKRSKGLLLIAGTMLFIAYYSFMKPIHHHGNTEITCFSVGQGSSSLIVTPTGNTILIDGGSGYSPGYSIGESVLRPYLFVKHIRTLDHLIITHPDSDHYNGLEFIIHHFSPKHIWISGIPSNLASYNDLISYARKHSIPVSSPERNTFISNNRHISLENFTDNDCSFKGNNDCGLVIRYQHEKFSMLFPADITKEREQQLLGLKNIQSTVMLSPHHGSKSSSSFAFLKKIRPEEIIISSGRSKYFPAQPVLDRYKSLDITFHLTRDNGSIIIESDGSDFQIIPTLISDKPIPQ